MLPQHVSNSPLTDAAMYTADLAASFSTTVIRVVFDTVASATPPNDTSSVRQADLIYALEDVYYAIDDGDLGLEFTYDGSNLTSDVIHTLLLPELELHCTDDEIASRSADMLHAWCVLCSVGSYILNGTCELCAPGLYQDEEGRSSCKPCPPHTSTPHSGTRNITGCRGHCQAGHYSVSGLQPCQPCTKGSYQERSGQIQCLSCPNRASTAQTASSSLQQCQPLCEENTYSDDGLQPCIACPMGTHQPAGGATMCLSCSGHNWNSRICPEEVDCSNSSIPCHHGYCLKTEGHTRCVCEMGYAGESCRLSIDDCPSISCLNEGTCIDGHLSATCLCLPEYTGARCGVAVDECWSSPCQHEGVCVDLEEGFMCICREGYSGLVCDVDLDECSSNPCQHGNCHHAVNSFTCYCDPGYTGIACDKKIDFCANVRCANGARCVNTGAHFSCVCGADTTGMFCEFMIDICLSSPCQHDGTCVTMDYGFHCSCPLGYTGPTCAISASPHFDAVFSESSVNNYITLRVWTPLHSLTFCSWLRTSDRFNRGAIVSYNAPSNWLTSHDANAFSLVDYADLQVRVNGEVVRTEYRLNDGMWHHVCVTWVGSSGEWHFYDNASPVAHGTGLAAGTHVESGGHLVLGQNHGDAGGAFIVGDGFLGEISQVFLLNRALSRQEVKSVAGRSRTDCQTHSPLVLDNAVIKWTEVLTGVRGNIRMRNTSMCLDVNACLTQYSLCGKGEYCVDSLGIDHQCLSCNTNHSMCEIACRSDTCRDDLGFCFHGADLEPSSAWSCDCDCSLYGPDIDPCASTPCLNDGQCLSLQPGLSHSFMCICTSQYTGIFCETLLFEGIQCPDDYCNHNGICEVESGLLKCTCEKEWRGNQCQIRHVSACDFAPCLNLGTCIETEHGGYYCQCSVNLQASASAVYGDNCELLSSCASQPCLNGGTCVDNKDGDSTCLCPDTFDGEYCQRQGDVPATTTPYFSTSVSSVSLTSSITSPTSVTSIFTEIEKQTSVEYVSPTTEQQEQDTSQPPPIVKDTSISDPCSNVQCQNGGTCRLQAGDFTCECGLAYTGSYCNIARPSETHGYRVRVTLLIEYSSSLANDPSFKHKFRRQVHRVYLSVCEESKLFVHILAVERGSCIVDFRLDHVIYTDVDAPDLLRMRSALRNELKLGHLGEFNASLDNFSFDVYGNGTEKRRMAMWLYILIGGVACCLGVAMVVFVVCYLRRIRHYSPQKMNNEALLFRNHIENPVFETQLSEFQAPQLRNITEENIYAEPTDCQTYETSKNSHPPSPLPPRRRNMEDSEKNRRFPSKGGKEINYEWGNRHSRKDVPLPPKPFDDYIDRRNDLDVDVKVDEEDEHQDEELRARNSPAIGNPDEEYMSPSSTEAPPTYQQAILSGPPDRPPPLPTSPPPSIDDGDSFPLLPRSPSRPKSGAYYFTPLSDDEAAILLMSRPGRPMCRRPVSLPLPTTKALEPPHAKPRQRKVVDDDENAATIRRECGNDDGDAVIRQRERGNDDGDAVIRRRERGNDDGDAVIRRRECGNDDGDAMIRRLECGNDDGDAVIRRRECGNDDGDAVIIRRERGNDDENTTTKRQELSDNDDNTTGTRQ